MTLTLKRYTMVAVITALVIGLVGACPDPGEPGSGGWKKMSQSSLR